MSIEVTKAPFTLTVVEGNRPRVMREIVFSNGDFLTFSVTLEADAEATIVDLHRKSAEELIARLQDWIDPSKD
jgi:hypothetical protein